MAINIALYCDNHSAVFLYDFGAQNISYYNNIIFIAQYLPSFWNEVLLLKIDMRVILLCRFRQLHRK